MIIKHKKHKRHKRHKKRRRHKKHRKHKKQIKQFKYKIIVQVKHIVKSLDKKLLKIKDQNQKNRKRNLQLRNKYNYKNNKKDNLYYKGMNRKIKENKEK